MDKYIKDSGMKLVSDTSQKSDDSTMDTEQHSHAYPWSAEEAVAENSKPSDDAQPAVERNTVIDGPTQVQSSVSGASQTDAVVSVKLNSELQQSFLQARNEEIKDLSRNRNAPNVEEEVAKERMQDVYIHDGFGKEEQDDAKKVTEGYGKGHALTGRLLMHPAKRVV